jgi:hypothetical protein
MAFAADRPSPLVPPITTMTLPASTGGNLSANGHFAIGHCDYRDHKPS